MSSSTISEYDAAVTLLNMRFGVRDTDQSVSGHSIEALECEKLLLNFVIVPNNPQTIGVPNITTTVTDGAAINTSFVDPNTNELSEQPSTSTMKTSGIPNITATVPNEAAINTSFTAPDTNELSEQHSTSTMKEPSKRKYPHSKPTNCSHVSADEEQQTSRRSKLFKRKPVYRYIAASNSSVDSDLISFKPENDAKNQVEAQDISHVGDPAIQDLTEANNHLKASDVAKGNCQTNCNGNVDNRIARYSRHLEKKVETRDSSNQTDAVPSALEIAVMESRIKNLYETIKILQEQRISRYISHSYDGDITHSTAYECTSFDDEPLKVDNKTKNKAGPIGAKVVLSNKNNLINGEMVPIGCGKTMIPASVYRHINWNSYTSATRKLLTAVFPRKVLATHCLTGKPSPAFQQKPAKKMLNPIIINDIIQTVSKRCGVPQNAVRTSITAKCADESKMLRTRQENKKTRQFKGKTENIPPDTESDCD